MLLNARKKGFLVIRWLKISFLFDFPNTFRQFLILHSIEYRMSTDSQDPKGSEHAFLEESIKNKYQVLGKIGSGAYGHVWKVKCKQTQSVYAIKKVFLAFQNETDAQRVYRQIALLTKLNHTNVIKLREVIASQNKNDIYLLFEYMDSDVFKAVKNRVLDQMHKKYIVYQLACALKYLHSAGVLHRDLKPSNILINSSCQVKVCDFGLSRTLQGQFFNRPIMTQFIATRWYRAPQVLLGSRAYSTKSDMWSLGCLIYELFSRRTLLPGENTIDQISKIVQFKGYPSSSEVQSFKAPKAAEILTFFTVQQKPLNFYFQDLEVQQIKPVLLNLLNYDPDNRWSAAQLLQCDFLKEFRETSTQAIAQNPVFLDLNDNRKYKLDKYKEEIIKTAQNNNMAGASTRRLLLYSYRSASNTKLSLHGVLSKGKSQKSINTTLRNRVRPTTKFQSACVSPALIESPRKGQKGPSCSLHMKRGSSISNIKHQSQHAQKNKNSQSNLFFKGKNKSPSMLKRQDSYSKNRLTIATKATNKSIIVRQTNKENCDRLRQLKKGPIRHFKNQSIM